ncbi:MAG TPA: FKBP-type peptidyl-prolyl cis-trans isomerase [Gemmatimonadaceae bacterium]|nr:FKBP-type peptidyl-prolyl cis-trans isomerase [Gemmatimonadaceae bacterium]
MIALRRLTPAVVLALASATACMHRGRDLPAPIPKINGDPRTAFALRFIDITPGSGALAAPRKCLFVNYTGWLTDGKKFDSSHDTTANGRPRTPLSFPQGGRRVIPGWDSGFEGMRVGAKRRLLIPYQLAYGELGRPPVIPPKAELIFDVELMAVSDTLPRAEGAPTGQAAPPPQCPTWETVSAAR